MLGKLPARLINRRIYRFANPLSVELLLRRRGLTSLAIHDVLTMFGFSSEKAAPDDVLDGPFKPKLQLARRFALPTRYSDGTWPVLYAAVDIKTAEKEVLHHFLRGLIGSRLRPRSVFYKRIRLQFRGAAVDICAMVKSWPLLIHPTDYSFCQRLGFDAHSRGIDGFLAPSARYSKGTNVPVFTRKSVSSPRQLGFSSFSTNSKKNGAITVQHK